MRNTIAFGLACFALSGCGQSGNSAGADNEGAAVAANAGAGAGDQAESDVLATSGLYPGSTPATGKDRYVTSTPIGEVIAWYRDKDARRAQNLSFSTERREDGFLIVGNDLSSLKSFIIHLVPAASGGTELRLYPFDYLAKGGTL